MGLGKVVTGGNKEFPTLGSSGFTGALQEGPRKTQGLPSSLGILFWGVGGGQPPHSFQQAAHYDEAQLTQFWVVIQEGTGSVSSQGQTSSSGCLSLRCSVQRMQCKYSDLKWRVVTIRGFSRQRSHRAWCLSWSGDFWEGSFRGSLTEGGSSRRSRTSQWQVSELIRDQQDQVGVWHDCLGG